MSSSSSWPSRPSAGLVNVDVDVDVDDDDDDSYWSDFTLRQSKSASLRKLSIRGRGVGVRGAAAAVVVG